MALTVLTAPVAEAAEFSDAEQAGVHREAVGSLAALGVLEGTDCSPGRFCPDSRPPRWTMAVWLVRTLDGGDPSPVDATRFSDVDAERWWAAHVERLAELGASPVCGSAEDRFCPYASLSRAQMAGVLARAFELDDSSPAGFVDTGGSVHESAIDALAAAGITRGCAAGPARFCPDRTVTRGEAASFLNRALAADTTLRWVSVGDSYSSGVGADPHGEGSCRRSPRAAGPAAAESLRRQGWPIDDLHLACQGARARDASPSLADGSPGSQWRLYEQLQGTSARADIVVVSVGGNDLGYAPVVLACLPFAAVTEFFTGGCPSEAELLSRVDGFIDTLDGLYREIVSKRLRQQGRLYVVGYPSLAAPSIEWNLFHPCRALYKPSTANMLGRVAQYLNSKMSEAAARAGDDLGGRVHYIDTYTRFRQGGHEVCGRGADLIHGVTHVGRNPLTGWHRSFHPNNAGHARIAQILEEQIRRTFPAP